MSIVESGAGNPIPPQPLGSMSQVSIALSGAIRAERARNVPLVTNALKAASLLMFLSLRRDERRRDLSACGYSANAC